MSKAIKIYSLFLLAGCAGTPAMTPNPAVSATPVQSVVNQAKNKTQIFFTPSLSPDGKTILIQKTIREFEDVNGKLLYPEFLANEFYTLSIADHKKLGDFNLPKDHTSSLEWSPDSQKLLALDKNKTTARIFSKEGLKLQDIKIPGSDGFIGWAGDSNSLLIDTAAKALSFSNEQYFRIERFDLDKQSRELVTELYGQMRGNTFSTSTTARYLLTEGSLTFQATNKSISVSKLEFVLIDTQKSVIRKIIPSDRLNSTDPIVHKININEDESKVYVLISNQASFGLDTLLVYDIAHDTAERHLIPELTVARDFVISPDGQGVLIQGFSEAKQAESSQNLEQAEQYIFFDSQTKTFTSSPGIIKTAQPVNLNIAFDPTMVFLQKDNHLIYSMLSGTYGSNKILYRQKLGSEKSEKLTPEEEILLRASDSKQ